MRIRKKTPKPSARRPPLYFVGYRGTAPATDELKIWYDREYGGPLTIRRPDWADVEQRFVTEYGLSRVYPSDVSPDTPIADLDRDIAARRTKAEGKEA